MVCFSDRQFWRVNFPSALDVGKSITVTVDASYTHALNPYPREITQSEKQYVVFNGNLYVLSPYTIKTQTTVVTTATNTIESYTKTKPVAASEKTITYGPFEDVAPLSSVSTAYFS